MRPRASYALLALSVALLRLTPFANMDATATAFAAEHVASSADDVERLDSELQPGDVLVLADGEWEDQQFTITASGTAEHPITVRSETPGKAVFTGSSSIRLAGDHLTLRGVQFRDFKSGDEAAIATSGAHCRVTDCAMTDGRTKFYVHLIGAHNRLDHCYIAGKASGDPTVQVEAPAERPNRSRIDHNHFGHRPPLGRNGGETIRVGYSHQGPNVSGLVCERNLFERCDGELEIISNKSSENVYRYNTFVECAGTLTLRHGDRCVVDANFFLGRGKPGTGGIRVLGDGQIVTNNYIDGVQYRAIFITAGVTEPGTKDHVRARNCVIAHNTVVNSAGPYLLLSAGLGNSPRRTLKPEHITLANNVFLVPAGVEVLGGPEGADYRWSGNLVEGADGVDESKVKRVDLRLAKDADGVWRPGPGSPVRNAAVSANAAALVVAEAAALFETDIDGQPRRAPADAGCDELSDEPVLNRPLTKRDVGPSWMLGIAGRESKAKALR